MSAQIICIYNRDRAFTNITYPSGRNVCNTLIQTRLDRMDATGGITIDPEYDCCSKITSISRNNREGVEYSYNGSLLTSLRLIANLLYGCGLRLMRGK